MIKEIEELFESTFLFDEFTETKTKCEFHCEFQEKELCNTAKIEPKYTGIIGDSDTRIMVIAEAPSSSGGNGPFCGGFIKDLYKTRQNRISPFLDLIDFVKENYNEIPYFTDLIKCGLSKQRNRSKLNQKRIQNCIQKFLRHEIRIINPKIIFCVGSRSYSEIIKLQKEQGQISSKIKIIRLLHYGRQANLPLQVKDKKEIIWKWQAGLIDLDELRRKLIKLNYFEIKDDIPPRAFCFNKSSIKAFVLGADPTNFSDNGNRKELVYAFGIGQNANYFRKILLNLNEIGLHLEDLYIQNLLPGYQKDQTGDNIYYIKDAVENTKAIASQFNRLDPKRELPVFLTAEAVYKAVISKKKNVYPAKEIYSGKIQIPIPSELNLLERPVIPLFRHDDYQMKKWEKYLQILKEFLTSNNMKP